MKLVRLKCGVVFFKRGVDYSKRIEIPINTIVKYIELNGDYINIIRLECGDFRRALSKSQTDSFIAGVEE